MGSKKSQSTTLQSASYDNRQVNTDSNNTTMSWDSSTNITQFTDGGAIVAMGDAAKAAINATLSLGQSALGNATKQAENAYDYSDGLFSASLDFAQDAGSRALQAYDRAAVVSDEAVKTVKAAYADAKGTTDSQQQIMLGVLAVAGVAVFAAIKGRG